MQLSTAPRIPLADTKTATGVVAGPTAGAAIASLAAPGAGVYEVTIAGVVGGAADADNMQIEKTTPTETVGRMMALPAGSGSLTMTLPRVSLVAGQGLRVIAVAGNAATYVAAIVATRIA